MYVDIVPNRNSRPAILLREGWREGREAAQELVTVPISRRKERRKEGAK